MAPTHAGDGALDVRRDWQLDVDVDDVLRSQAADPAEIRARSPRLVQFAEEALEQGRELIDPAVLATTKRVADVRHNHILLEGGGRITGPLVVEHLAAAEEVTVMLCSIGSRLPDRATEVSDTHVVRGMALDAVGSAAVHSLAAAACNRVEDDAVERQMHASLPLSPGLDGWPVDVGQRDIFSMIDPREIGVELTSSSQMVPIKSVTVVLGVGAHVTATGQICDYCSLRHTCRQKPA